MNNTRRMMGLCLILLAVFLSGSGMTQNVDAQKMDAVLAKVAIYDWGMSREPLTQWSAMEQSAYKDPSTLKVLEKKLVAILTTNAPLAAKQFICQRLSIIGTAASVPVLAQLLKNETTADMARYALERIPGREVDTVLEKALAKSTGLVKIGIVNTLGQRADAKAADALSKLLNNNDPALVTAAAAALGKIGDPVSTIALEKALPKMKGTILPVALDAYLKCADKMTQSGKTTEAMAIYSKLQGNEYPDPMRAAALRGQIMTDKSNAASILLQTIQKADSPLKSMAITLMSALASGEKMAPFADQLSQLSPELKVQLLAALAGRGDRSISEKVVAATKDENSAVRIAALKALTQLGNATTIPVLVRAAAEKIDDEKKAAQESLYLLNGPDVDGAVVQAIAANSGAEKVELITAVGERNITSTSSLLFGTAQDSDAKVRVASVKVLGQIASANDMPALIDLLLKTRTESEQNEAITALTAVSQKIADPAKRAELVLAKLPEVKEENGKIALMRVLGRIGAAPGLPVLRSALKTKSEEMQIAAIRALSDWPTAEPIDDLHGQAKTGVTLRHQVLALRGFIRLVKIGNNRPEDQTIALYQQAMMLAKEPGEKKSVLSALGDMNSLPALTTAVSYLQDETIQDEVAAAVLMLSRRLYRDNPEKVKNAVTQVLTVVKNESLKADLQNILSRTK